MCVRLLLLLLCTGTFFSCKNTTAPAAKTENIRERKWRCVELNGSTPAVDHMFIVFYDTTFGGRGACNSFGGAATWLPPSGIRLRNIISTEMACEGLPAEQAFFAALQSADQYRLSGDSLTLLKGKIAPVLKFIPEK